MQRPTFTSQLEPVESAGARLIGVLVALVLAALVLLLLLVDTGTLLQHGAMLRDNLRAFRRHLEAAVKKHFPSIFHDV